MYRGLYRVSNKPFPSSNRVHNPSVHNPARAFKFPTKNTVRFASLVRERLYSTVPLYLTRSHIPGQFKACSPCSENLGRRDHYTGSTHKFAIFGVFARNCEAISIFSIYHTATSLFLQYANSARIKHQILFIIHYQC